MRQKGVRGFVAGFVTAAVLFGGLAAAAGFERQITVYFRPLRYVFDGVEKQPPADQQGFVYNGRTYVPLRFLTESLGRPVEWDEATGSIYVGALPGQTPAIWSAVSQQGEGSFKIQHFTSRALSADGAEMPEATVISLIGLAGEGDGERSVIPSQLWVDYTVPQGATRMKGTLYAPLQYFGIQDERRIGRIAVLNDLNQTVFTSPDVTTRSGSVPFEVPVSGGKRIRVVVSMYPYDGVRADDRVLVTQLGISGLRFE